MWPNLGTTCQSSPDTPIRVPRKNLTRAHRGDEAWVLLLGPTKWMVNDPHYSNLLIVAHKLES